MTPSGATTVAAVIGDPIRHSLSPAIHNAAFAAAGLDWVFVALEVAAGDGAAALAGARALGLGGLSVTMPHKSDVARAVDRLSADALALGAVNTVVRDGSDLVGHSTDGPGLMAALREAGIDPAGRRALVVGAGGAARAVILALARSGASSVVVAARRSSAAQEAAELAGQIGRTGTLSDAAECDLIINATPLGMAAGDPLPVEVDHLGPSQVVVDLVYHPARTPFLEAAQARGAQVEGGVAMLVHQAALAFELWTGLGAPLTAMASAAAAELARG